MDSSIVSALSAILGSLVGGSGTKIMIEMTPENYDLFLSKLSKASASNTILKNGVVTGGSVKENRIIEIACEMFEAKMLLNVAQMLCPEVALEIDKGVTLARPFQT
jgi:hypothetical protein